MAIHVAILKRAYLRGILDGWKTIESRLYRVAQPPLGRIAEGERLFLKVSAGPWMATAVAARVDTFNDLTPARVDALRREFGHAIGGDDEYWAGKQSSRYAILVHLDRVEPLDVGPAYHKTQRAWHVLDDRLSPLHDVPLTAGAIRNRYALFPPSPDAAPSTVDLLLPDGERVRTAVLGGRRIQWRGWGRLYRDHAVAAGDVMRFVAVEPACFRVSFHPPPR